MRSCAWTLLPEMTPAETSFLKAMVRRSSPSDRCLEIGTAAGGSLCEMIRSFWPRSAPAFVVVDPMNYFPNQRRVVSRNLRRNHIDPKTIDFRDVRSSKAFSDSVSAGEQFAFILIDGDHKMSSVVSDLRWATLLKQGGIICIHDYESRFLGVRWATNIFLLGNRSFEVIGKQGSLLAVQRTSEGGSHLRNRTAFLFACVLARYADALRTIARSQRRLRRKFEKLFRGHIVEARKSADTSSRVWHFSFCRPLEAISSRNQTTSPGTCADFLTRNRSAVQTRAISSHSSRVRWNSIVCTLDPSALSRISVPRCRIPTARLTRFERSLSAK